MAWLFEEPGGCFTNFSRALQNNLAKIYNASNHIYGENFKLKFCKCFGHINKVSAWNAHRKCDFCNTQISREYFGESRNVSETTPRASAGINSTGLNNLCPLPKSSQQGVNGYMLIDELVNVHDDCVNWWSCECILWICYLIKLWMYMYVFLISSQSGCFYSGKYIWNYNDLKTMHTVCTLLCLGFECYTHFFRIPSLALGQSYDCPSANEATLKKMGKLSQESQGTNDTASLPGNNVHKTVDFLWDILYFMSLYPPNNKVVLPLSWMVLL